MTTIFDTPSGSTPLNNVAAIKAGTLNYNWQPIPDGYDIKTETSFNDAVPAPGGPWPAPTMLDDWMANNAVSYNAFDGQFSVDFTEVEFSNGVCQTGPSDVLEWPCLLLEHFNINALTNMRQGTLFLQPKEWSYIVTINVQQGEIADTERLQHGRNG